MPRWWSQRLPVARLREVLDIDAPDDAEALDRLGDRADSDRITYQEVAHGAWAHVARALQAAGETILDNDRREARR